MGKRVRAVTANTLGAWLIKGSEDVYPVDKLIRNRFTTVTSWSVRESYRTDLIKPNQLVLFWISGSSEIYPG